MVRSVKLDHAPVTSSAFTKLERGSDFFSYPRLPKSHLTHNLSDCFIRKSDRVILDEFFMHEGRIVLAILLGDNGSRLVVRGDWHLMIAGLAS